MQTSQDPLSIQEVADLYWSCLESQSNAGIQWETLCRIPAELAKLAPVSRQIIYINAGGAVLRDTLRIYSEAAARTLCESIGWDPVRELSNGIAAAKQSFRDRINAYYASAAAFKRYTM